MAAIRARILSPTGPSPVGAMTSRAVLPSWNQTWLAPCMVPLQLGVTPRMRL